MKIILSIVIALLFMGCITQKEIHFVALSNDPIKQNEAVSHRYNRFERQFNQADSVFMLKLREASRQAVIETNKQINDIK